MGLFSVADKIGKGIKDIFTGAGDGVSKIITTAKDKVPPEMRGEIEKIGIEITGELEKQRNEIDFKIEQIFLENQKDLRSFVLKYEGSADQVPKWILILRSVIRPLITMIMFLSYILFVGMDVYNLWQKTPDYNMIQVLLPNGFWVIFGLIIGFWFGGKAGENIADKLKGNK